MHRRKFALLFAALVIAAAGCGGDGGDGGDGGAGPEAPEQDMRDGVAAVVNGEEIRSATVDQKVEVAAKSPEIAAQLDGQRGEEARGLLRAQILSMAIETQVAIESAEQLDRPVTDESVAEARAELQDQVGGAEALADALEQQGLSESQLDVELSGFVAMRHIEEALLEDLGEEPPDAEAPTAGDAPSPSQQLARQHLVDQLAAAEVTVSDEYGTWDPDTGRVTPPGGMPAPVPDAPVPEPDTGS